MESKDIPGMIAEHDQACKALQETLPAHLAGMLKQYESNGFSHAEAFTLVRDELTATLRNGKDINDAKDKAG
jgi:hypothetical protein